MTRSRKSVAEMQLALLRDRPPSIPPASGDRANSREEFELRAKGYTPHDGGACPVAPTQWPGVVFVDGSFLRSGQRRAEDIDWSRVRGWKLGIPGGSSPGLNFGGGRMAALSDKLRARGKRSEDRDDGDA